MILVKVHDIKDKLGVKNMSDLTIKTTKDIYDTETLTKEQIKKYRRNGKEFIAGLDICEDLALKLMMYCGKVGSRKLKK